MARRVFFSFHFDEDCFRANQVRNANVVLGTEDAGYFDHSEYEDARKRGPQAIRQMILRHLERTSVTVVLIGTNTFNRPWVQVEISESIKRGNGLLGIRINHLLSAGQHGYPSLPGPIPHTGSTPMPVYWWDSTDVQGFGRLVEEAGKRSDAIKEAQKRVLRALIAPDPAPGGTLADLLFNMSKEGRFKS
jgi:hypothetical protein